MACKPARSRAITETDFATSLAMAAVASARILSIVELYHLFCCAILPIINFVDANRCFFSASYFLRTDLMEESDLADSNDMAFNNSFLFLDRRIFNSFDSFTSVEILASNFWMRVLLVSSSFLVSESSYT